MNQAELCRTNLGKWGASTTQTYEEHTYATWVFRRPLLALVHRVLEEHGAADVWDDYLKIAELETREHDYDKLYVPREMVPDLKRFAWHGDLSHPADELALNRRLDDLQDRVHELPTDRYILSDVLKAANFSHEGRLIPAKVSAAREALQKVFEALGCSLASSALNSLAKMHVRTLRAADAIVSARADPAFKDDVSALANDTAEILPGALIRIVAICFDTAFANASSLAVLAGYYQFYHAAFLALDRILSPSGLVVADSARTLVGMALTTASRQSLERGLWDNLRQELQLTSQAETALESVLALRAVDIDLVSSPTTFDQEWRKSLMDLLAASYTGDTGRHGLPCATCGRNVVRAAASDVPKALADEVASLESRGDFGFYRQVKVPLFGLNRGGVRGKSDKPICPACTALARLSEERPAPATLVLTGMDSRYEGDDVTVRLTSSAENPLTRSLYAFELQKKLLQEYRDQASVTAEDSRLIAASAVRTRFTPSARGLLRQVIEPARTATAARVIALPDGRVIFEPDFGIRIGAGSYLLGATVHDSTYLNGVFSIERYSSLLEGAVRIEALLAQLSDQREIDACLARLPLRKGHAAIIHEAISSAEESLPRLVRQARPPMGPARKAARASDLTSTRGYGTVSLGAVDGIVELADAIVSNPEATITLRQIRDAAIKDAKATGEGEE